MIRDWITGHSRRISLISVLFGAAALAILVMLVSLPAFAQALPLDPTTVIQNEYPQWIATAQSIATSIYYSLIVFEVIALAVTTLLFRENLGEFFASLGFKIFMGNVFYLLIINGPSLAQAVINFFTSLGKNQFGGPGGAADPYLLFGGALTAAGLLFGAADTAHAADQVALTTLTIPPLCEWFPFGEGICPVASIIAAANSNSAFVLIVQGVAMIILMATAAIILQFFVVTIESFLVMSVGVLFLGFAGSRFTFSFSQGYFSYMINVGVKLMVTYIMLGIATNELLPILAGAAITSLGASLIPFGLGDGLAMAGVALTAVYVVLTAGLLWTIPAFAGALLTGQSQSSGAAILQQAVGTMAGAASMIAQFGAARQSLGDARTGIDSATGTEQGSSGGAPSLAAGSQNMSPAQSTDRFEQNPPTSTSGSSAIPASIGGGGALGVSNPGNQVSFGPLNPQTGASYSTIAQPSRGSQSLAGVTPEEFRTMPESGRLERYTNTPNVNDLNMNLIDAMRADPQFLAEAQQSDRERAERDDRQAELAMAYGMQGLAQMAPRDIGQPTAVQVRLSNPDKL